MILIFLPIKRFNCQTIIRHFKTENDKFFKQKRTINKPQTFAMHHMVSAVALPSLA